MPVPAVKPDALRSANGVLLRGVGVVLLSATFGLFVARSRASKISIDWPASHRSGSSVIFIDDTEVGFTLSPTITVRVAPGVHDVLLQRPGFKPFEQQVTLAAGSSVTIAPEWAASPDLANQQAAEQLITGWNKNTAVARNSSVARETRASATRLFWSLEEDAARERCRQILRAVPSEFARRLDEPLVKGGLPNVIATLGPPTWRHAGAVTQVRFRPGRRTLFSSGVDGRINVWSLESGDLIRSLVGHRSGVRDFDMTPDGKRLVSGGDDGRVLLWSLDDFDFYEMSKPHGAVRSVTVSPDGRRFVTGGADNRIRIWSIDKREPTKELAATHQVRATCWSNDGRYAAGGDANGRVVIWDADSDTTTVLRGGPPAAVLSFSSNGRFLTAVGANLRDATWSLDAPNNPKVRNGRQTLAVASDLSWSLRGSASDANVAELIEVREVDDPPKLRLRPIESPERVSVTAAARSEQADRLAIGQSDGSIAVFQIGREQAVQTPSAIEDRINAVAVTTDGSTLFAGTVAGKVQAWDVFSREKRLDTIAASEPIVHIGVTNENRSVVASTQTSLTIVDVNRPEQRTTFGISGPVTVATAGNEFAYVSDEGIVWVQLNDQGLLARTLPSNNAWQHLRLDPAGKRLLAVSNNGEVQRLKPDPNSPTGLIVTHAYLSKPVTSVAWETPSEAKFVRPNETGRWFFSEAGTTTELTRRAEPAGTQLLVPSCEGTLRITGGRVERDDATTATTSEVAVFAGESCEIKDAAASPNGGYLAVVDATGSVMLLDLSTSPSSGQTNE